MPKIRPVQPTPVPAPAPAEPLKTIKSIQTVSEPQVARKHMLQFISDVEGNNWRCLCGHVYPRPPVEVLLTGTLDSWLNPLVEKHETA